MLFPKPLCRPFRPRGQATIPSGFCHRARRSRRCRSCHPGDVWSYRKSMMGFIATVLRTVLTKSLSAIRSGSWPFMAGSSCAGVGPCSVGRIGCRPSDNRPESLRSQDRGQAVQLQGARRIGRSPRLLNREWRDRSQSAVGRLLSLRAPRDSERPACGRTLLQRMPAPSWTNPNRGADPVRLF